jgi:hypothetical protein
MRETQSELIPRTGTQARQVPAGSVPAESPFIPHGDHLSRAFDGRTDVVAHSSELNRLRSGAPSRAEHLLLHLQRTHGNRYVQRVLAIARRGEGEGEGEVTPEVESGIEQSRGGGQSMDTGTRRQMESAFGTDFTGVRIHTGSQAHTLNRAVSAVAFTTGQDIYFSDGAYEPQNSVGRELLAHELTHVVQQTNPPASPGTAQRLAIQRMCSHCEEEKKQKVQTKLVVGRPDDQYEREAEEVARHVSRNEDSLHDASDAIQGDHDHRGSPAEIELIPDRQFTESPLGDRKSNGQASAFESVNIKEVLISRNGVRRRLSLGNRPDAWIARKMNWKDTACKAACWAAGGALAVLITGACAVGEVFTLGGATIPCAIALGMIGAAVGGAGASVCSDLCDNSLSNSSASAAPAPGQAAPQNGVADANGAPVEVPEGANV